MSQAHNFGIRFVLKDYIQVCSTMKYIELVSNGFFNCLKEMQKEMQTFMYSYNAIICVPLKKMRTRLNKFLDLKGLLSYDQYLFEI